MLRVFWFLVLTCVAAPVLAAPPIAQLHLPPGFAVSVYSDQVPHARGMTLGAHGTVFVGSTSAGKVYALTDPNHDGHVDHVYTVASGLKLPVGVAYHDGNLYASAINRIVELRGITGHLADPPQPVTITDKLPDKMHHGWRYIAFGPDGRLYVSIGAPCNVCIPPPGTGRIISMNAHGGDWKTVATGVRDSVGFTWQPGTGKLWFTDNGRDMLGDNEPSDELNRVDHAGEDFGFPYCHAGDIPDPKYGAGHPCSDFVPPVLKLGAHVAALGLRFYTGHMFPASYDGGLFIAEHGSWNRSSKVGYRVMVVHFKHGKIVSYKPFLTGFLQGQKEWGRPVDVLVLPDGSLLVSDDYAGAIYRITWHRPG